MKAGDKIRTILANDLGRQYQLFQREHEDAAIRTLRSGWYALGNEVRAFEEEWANYVDAKYCIGPASGQDALWITLLLLGIGGGDEVNQKASAIIAFQLFFRAGICYTVEYWQV